MGEGVQALAQRLDRMQEASLDSQLLRSPRKEMLGSLLTPSWATRSLSSPHSPLVSSSLGTPALANPTGFLEHRVLEGVFCVSALLACLSY